MFKYIPKILLIAGLSYSVTFNISVANPITPAASQLIELQEVKDFIKEMHTKHNFNEATLTQLFSNIQPRTEVIKSIKSPAEALPWYKYKTIFLGDTRVKQGVKFWDKHAATLKRAEETFGVPAEIIVAILGVETHFGKFTGKHKVLDALATLAFNYSPRAKFFKQELEAYLLFTREEKLDPTVLTGSYAGAMGAPQFIASSYRAYAVDFSGTGQRDLINDIEDSIGSVANYFKVHGWKANEPIIMPATTQGDKFKNFVANKANPKPKYTPQELAKNGVKLNSTIASNKPKNLDSKNIALIELEEKSGPTYWLGLDNFYVITRYNHSSHYAMAVYELSQKIKNARKIQST